MEIMWVSWTKHYIISLKMLNRKTKQRSQDLDVCKWSDLLQIIGNHMWRDEIDGVMVSRERHRKKILCIVKLNKSFTFFFFLGDKNKSHQHFTAKMKEGGEGKLF